MISEENLKKIKLILFDLKGVLTDKDGEFEEDLINGIGELIATADKLGIDVGLISGSDIIVPLERLRGAGIRVVFNSAIDKVTPVSDYLKSRSLLYENVFFIADDILDLPLLNKVGIGAVPPSASRNVKRSVDHILKSEKSVDIVGEINNYLNGLLNEAPRRPTV
jgi:YrbI family 3-deoxy-D-manno-octulosonate 8-phosphate phosphatase